MFRHQGICLKVPTLPHLIQTFPSPLPKILLRKRQLLTCFRSTAPGRLLSTDLESTTDLSKVRKKSLQFRSAPEYLQGSQPAARCFQGLPDVQGDLWGENIVSPLYFPFDLWFFFRDPSPGSAQSPLLPAQSPWCPFWAWGATCPSCPRSTWGRGRPRGAAAALLLLAAAAAAAVRRSRRSRPTTPP